MMSLFFSLRESRESSSQSLTAGTSESIVFADSSDPSNKQVCHYLVTYIKNMILKD